MVESGQRLIVPDEGEEGGFRWVGLVSVFVTNLLEVTVQFACSNVVRVLQERKGFLFRFCLVHQHEDCAQSC